MTSKPLPVNRVVEAVRRRAPGLCLPHSVVACEAIKRLGGDAVVMMIGDFQHFYLHVKDHGKVDVFPNYNGELSGSFIDITIYQLFDRQRMAEIVDEGVEEVKHGKGV